MGTSVSYISHMIFCWLRQKQTHPVHKPLESAWSHCMRLVSKWVRCLMFKNLSRLFYTQECVWSYSFYLSWIGFI